MTLAAVVMGFWRDASDFGVKRGCKTSWSSLSSPPSPLSVPSFSLLLLLLLSELLSSLMDRAASSGSRNEICEISSVFFCMMADEHSRLSRTFSLSFKFNLCSVLAWLAKSFPWPKLSLQMKHIKIGFWRWFELASRPSSLPVASCGVRGDWSPMDAVGGEVMGVGVDAVFIVASRDEITRNEWIFGLFDCDTSGGV